MDSKGQSALEYLMTYGWALVVIVIVVAALFAFGIFTPPSLGPCTGLSKLLYQDHGISSDGATFTLVVANGTGGTMVNTACDTDKGAACKVDGVDDTNVSSGSSTTITETASPVLTSPYTVTIDITYESYAGVAHTETATCKG